MDANVTLNHLREMVSRFSTDLRGVITEADAKSAARVLGVVATTLDESKVRIEPNEHMLRTSEAKAVAGYLRAKYRAGAKRAYYERKTSLSASYVNARKDLLDEGTTRPSSDLIGARAESSDDYVTATNNEVLRQEAADHFEYLWFALSDRLEVLIEISRNERALIKHSEDAHA